MNRFSNDIGNLDNRMAALLIHVMSKLIQQFVIFASIIKLELFYLLSALGCFAFVIGFYLYCKDSILNVRKISLELKTPTFTQLRETISGLTTIRVYGQRSRILAQFANTLDLALKGSICSILLERCFAFYIYLGVVVILLIGMSVGAMKLTAENSTYFGVQILLLIRLTQSVQVLLEKVVMANTLIINA